MQNKIVLYSNNCPRCNVLKNKLDERSLLYQENNSIDEMIEIGITQTPVLSIDGTMYQFKEAIDWVNKQ